jgi:predicted amidohydrolase YtcJ
MRNFIPVLILVAVLISCSKHPVADQVVFGKTWTGDDSKPWAEAFAIVGDSVVAVGSLEEIEKWVGPEYKEN